MVINKVKKMMTVHNQSALRRPSINNLDTAVDLTIMRLQEEFDLERAKMQQNKTRIELIRKTFRVDSSCQTNTLKELNELWAEENALLIKQIRTKEESTSLDFVLSDAKTQNQIALENYLGKRVLTGSDVFNVSSKKTYPQLSVLPKFKTTITIKK